MRKIILMAIAIMILSIPVSALTQGVTNGGFETGTFVGWTLVQQPARQFIASSPTPHSGTYIANGNPNPSVVGMSTSVIVNNATLDFWYRSSNPSSITFNVSAPNCTTFSQTTSSNTWQHGTLNMAGDIGITTTVNFTMYGAPDSGYWDDVSMLNPDPVVSPPVSFTSNNAGTYPRTVAFTDTSTMLSITSRNWTYINATPGNNTEISFSTVANPSQYFGFGNYNIHLSVTNASQTNKTTDDYWINSSRSGYLDYYAYGDSITRATGGDALPADGSGVYIIQMNTTYDPTAFANHNQDGGGWTSADGLANVATHFNNGNGSIGKYFIEFGFNDPAAGIPAATTSQNLKAIYDYAAAHGATPYILIKTMATSTGADWNNVANQHSNTTLVETNFTANGYRFIKYYDSIDSITYNGIADDSNATLLYDGTQHPNFEAHGYMGKYIWQYLTGTLPGTTINSAFTTNVTSGHIPLTVSFTDASSYLNATPATYLWTFGDGNTSTSRNTTNTFVSAGVYNVSYKVSNTSMLVDSTSYQLITATGIGGFNRVDLTMSQQFPFTLNIVDVNGNFIPVVLVSDSNGYNATTTNGIFTYQYPYSAVVFYLSSAGYASKSVSYIISGNTTETVVMTAVTTTSQNANVIFSPRSVAIQILDANYNPIVNDPVYVNAYSSSLPGGLAGAIGYFKTTYGVAESTAQSMLAANTTYYGVTDDYGFVAIQVADIIQYKIITHDTTGTNTSRLMWPSGPYYQIVTDTAAVAGIAAQGRSQANINRNSTFNTTFWEPNTTHSCMGINVYDSTGQTNNVYAWWKLVDNGTVWWTNATAIGGYGPINSTKCVLHVPYQQWKWGGITG